MKKEKVKQSWGPFWRLVRKNTPWLLMIIAVASTGYTIFVDVRIPKLQGRILGGEIFDTGLIWEYVILNTLSMFLSYVAQYLQLHAQYLMTYNIQARLWNKLVEMPMSLFNRTTSTTLVSRVTSDTETLPEIVYSTLSLVVRVASVVNIYRAIYLIHPKIALSLLLTLPYIILVMVIPGRIYFSVNRKKQTALARFTSYVAERLSNLRLVKAAAAEEREDILGDEVLLENYRAKVLNVLVECAVNPFISTLESVMTAVALIVTARLVASNELQQSSISIIYFQVSTLYLSIHVPMTSFIELKCVQGAASEVSALLDLEPEQVRREQTFTMDDADIVFDDVSFRYGDKDVLSHVSFTIPSGKTTAIVGPSGAGKTTILSLLERLYTPTGGTIRFGDTPVEKINLDDWRRAMGYIQQESPLITGTVRENIAYGLDREPTQAGVEEAAALANISGLIETLPEGYDTDIGQMGGKLSGGERQRVALARMIITRPNYLLLDEATASLDAENSAAVQKALRQISVGRTTIIVAHDINTVRHADNIIVLEGGRVQAAGPHEKVYQESGIYHRYCDLLTINLIEV